MCYTYANYLVIPAQHKYGDQNIIIFHQCSGLQFARYILSELNINQKMFVSWWRCLMLTTVTVILSHHHELWSRY